MGQTPVTLSDLDFSWREKMPGGSVAPLTYYKYVQALLAKGQHQYRKEGILYAVPCDGLKITTTNNAGGIEKETVQKAEKIILRFDADRYAHAKDREKAVRKIYQNAAERDLSQEALNNPDFFGTDIWTWTEKQWEKERQHLIQVPGENGKWVFTDEGWEETSRVILDDGTIKEDTSFPYSWGNFAVQAGGSIACYAHDIEAISHSVQAIKDDLERLSDQAQAQSISQSALLEALTVKHLFNEHTNPDTQAASYITAFDIYGQNPGFARAQFHSKAAHEKALRQDNSSLVQIGRYVSRSLRYGLPGARHSVKSVHEIDRAMQKIHAQNQDAPHHSAA